jgi:hypothetical protein
LGKKIYAALKERRSQIGGLTEDKVEREEFTEVKKGIMNKMKDK